MYPLRIFPLTSQNFDKNQIFIMHSFFSSKNVSIFNRISVKRTRACNDFFFFSIKNLKNRDCRFSRENSQNQSANLDKSSRFTPKPQRFHAPNLKILKIYTLRINFSPKKRQNPQDLHPSLKVSPSRASNFKGFSQTQGSRFPSTHTYRTAPSACTLIVKLLFVYTLNRSVDDCRVSTEITHFSTHQQLFQFIYTSRRVDFFFFQNVFTVSVIATSFMKYTKICVNSFKTS